MAAVALAIYLLQVPAGVGVGDEAEAQTVPYILGIAHTPGFPAFALAGWVASHIVPFASVVWRMNAFNAACTAAGAAGIVLLAVELGAVILSEAAAAFVFVFGNTIWNGALHVNVQVLAATLAIYCLWTAVRFSRDGSTRNLFAACGLSGLGIAAHPAVIWIVPGVIVAALIQWRCMSVKVLAVGVLAFIVPLLLYGYVPLRAHVIAAHGLDPLAAAPFDGLGSFDWSTDSLQGSGSVAERFVGHGDVAVLRSLDPGRLPQAANNWIVLALAQYRLLFLLLAGAGFVALVQSNRRALAVLIAGTLGGVAFAYTYRLDTHLDRYLIVSFAVTAAVAAASTQLRIPRVPDMAVRTIALIGLALLAVNAGTNNGPLPPSRLDVPGEAVIAAARHDTPANAIVIAQWNDATALGYGTFVEHSLDGRTIVNAWPNQFSDRYETWARTRPVILFVSPLAALRIYPMWATLRELDSTLPTYRVFAVVPPRPHRHRRR